MKYKTQLINPPKPRPLPDNSDNDNTPNFKCFYSVFNPLATPSNPNSITSSLPPLYFSGSQLVNLYNVQPVNNNAGIRKVIIAIVVAYHYDNLIADLNTYWKNGINYGPNSSPPNVIVHNLSSSNSSSQSIRSGWAQEECLDVQMVCTINPNADIHVVEAVSDRPIDLIAAVTYAKNNVFADVISMSWGGNDNTAFNTYNTTFMNPTIATQQNQNICFCASSGDENTVSWPSVLYNCISVGGTTLTWNPTTQNPSTRTEYSWPQAGCGYSISVNKPYFQNYSSSGVNVVNTSNKRTIPDVSLIANPQSSVYTVYNGKWYGVGGTSVSTPIFAAILSISNQIRLNNNLKLLTSYYNVPFITNSSQPPNVPSTNVQAYIYNNYSPNLFYDITIGTDAGTSTSGSTVTFTTLNRYDIPTGLGSPNCNNLCNALASIM
jgi:kumamolisin